MTMLYLVRHGETTWNAEGRYQGQANPALNERGRQQAYALADALSDISFDAMITSDLDRAQGTADIIAPGVHTAEPDERWRELSFGQWEGKKFEQIAEFDSIRLGAWVDDPTGSPPPGGEGLRQLADRVCQAASELCLKYPDGNVLVVTHGGPIRCLVAEWVLGGLHRMSDVQTEPGTVTVMNVAPRQSPDAAWSAQVEEFDVRQPAKYV